MLWSKNRKNIWISSSASSTLNFWNEFVLFVCFKGLPKCWFIPLCRLDYFKCLINLCHHQFATIFWNCPGHSNKWSEFHQAKNEITKVEPFQRSLWYVFFFKSNHGSSQVVSLFSMHARHLDWIHKVNHLWPNEKPIMLHVAIHITYYFWDIKGNILKTGNSMWKCNSKLFKINDNIMWSLFGWCLWMLLHQICQIIIAVNLNLDILPFCSH